MINVAVVVHEGNYEFSNYLTKLVSRIFEQYNRKLNIEEYTNGSELIKNVELKIKHYEIIILEVNDEKFSGFEIAYRLRQIDNTFLLIFVTDLKEEAIRGYEYCTYRFILKKDIEVGINEAFSHLLNTKNSLANKIIKFKIKESNSYETIEVKEKDIIQLYKKDRKTFLETTYSTYELLQYTLKHYEREINKNNFIIVFRSHLINLYNVTELIGDYFILQNGKSVCIGTKKEIIDKVRFKYTNYIVNELQ